MTTDDLENPKDTRPTSCTKGKYLEHRSHGGFVYEYWCKHCRGRFEQYVPELNDPVLCHACFTGRRSEKRKKTQND